MDSNVSMILSAGDALALNTMGARIELLLESEQTGGAFDLFVGTLPPNSGPPLHRHKEAEALYVLEGQVAFRTSPDSPPRIEGPGGMLYAPPMMPHGFFNAGESPARILAIMSPAGFAGLFRETALPEGAEPPAGPPPPEVIERMMAAFGRYGMEVLEAPPGA